MSAPSTKFSKPGPARVPSGRSDPKPPQAPPQAAAAVGRQANQPEPPKQQAYTSKGPPVFYNGPAKTQAEHAKGKAQDIAKTTVVEAKRQTRKAVATARRHPWGVISLITTLPFLLAISLFSTVVCPPPDAPYSLASRTILQPFGLHDASSPHSALHQTLCYPANVYNREVLKPYIHPVLENAQTRVTTHPVYKGAVEPGVQAVTRSAQRVWDGPVRPVVDRLTQTTRRLFLRYVQPHIPFLKARYDALTAPYAVRLSSLHNTYLAPHFDAAQSYAQAGASKAARSYHYASKHPVTDQAGKYANAGYHIGKQRGSQAYAFSRPHAVRTAGHAKRIAEEILGPKVMAGLSWSGNQAVQTWEVVAANIVRLYYTHIDPHVGPHVSKATAIASPYASVFVAKVYNPYIRPAVEAVLPMTVFAPEKPKTFWSLIADKLPSGPGSIAGNKGSISDTYKRGSEKAGKTASSLSRTASKSVATASKSVASAASRASASVSSAAKEVKTAAKSNVMTRSEMTEAIASLSQTIEKQGKAGYKKVQSELIHYGGDILSDQTKFHQLADSAQSELQSESDYILKGLDKLYTTSTSLNRDQVRESSEVSDSRFAKRVSTVKDRVEKKGSIWQDGAKPIVQRAVHDLHVTAQGDLAKLHSQIASMEGVSSRELTKVDDLRKSIVEWENKYIALQSGAVTDKQLSDASVNVAKATEKLKAELSEIQEGFRERIGVLKRIALDRIAAREAMASSSSKSSASSSKSHTNSGHATILPVVQAAAAGEGAQGIIGKGKEQILDALRQASEAAMAESSTGALEPSTRVLDQVRSAGAAVTESASSLVHEATESVLSAVGVTAPVESLVSTASESASSLGSVAKDGLHDVTRSAKNAAGATGSIESLAEYAESLVDAATNSVSSLGSVASEAVHQGTRSVMSAVGATPSPEGAQEHLESVLGNVAQGYASVAEAVGDNLHQATKAVGDAVTGTATPESLGGHVQSVASRASGSAASMASVASSAVHDGSRSAMKVVGVSPTPESLAEHVESLASGVSATAVSVASAASSAVHAGTREAMRAVGVSPTPESPGEHAQSIASAVSSGAASRVGDVTSVVGEATGSAASVYETASSSAASAYDAAGSSVSSVIDLAASSASSVYDAAASVVTSANAAVADQAALLASQIQSALGYVPTTTPIASSASSYLSSLADQGYSAGSEVLVSGSSLLVSLQSEASVSLHSATRGVSRAAGATPSPESAGEYVEAITEAIKEQVQKVIGRDEL